ncbi:hypothetical protein NDU88_010634 [Pleurodeles waltl]|uniref:Uncharacterized protein n=1 Tax=Pleurodeles waltl TaxID=8319 RepID=A0AAV7QZC1_PLEWA|nr:hypothetical protein NDU88_010634 [Pleurodeles waltl]
MQSRGAELARHRPRCLWGGLVHREPSRSWCGPWAEEPHGGRGRGTGPAVNAGGWHAPEWTRLLVEADFEWTAGIGDCLRRGEVLGESGAVWRIACGDLRALILPPVASASGGEVRIRREQRLRWKRRGPAPA